MKKTNAMRILENLNIEFTASEYEDNTDHKLAHGAAVNSAAKIGVNPEQVFKTILFRTDKKEIYVFCQAANSEINLKKARNACNAKEVTPVKEAELLSLTGYVRGGCSPLGMKKQYKTFIDESCLAHDKIYISAGLRGMHLCLNPNDLIKVLDATVADLKL